MTTSKLQPCLLKQHLKTQKKLKELEKTISGSLGTKKLLISSEKVLVSVELRGFVA